MSCMSGSSNLNSFRDRGAGGRTVGVLWGVAARTCSGLHAAFLCYSIKNLFRMCHISSVRIAYTHIYTHAYIYIYIYIYISLHIMPYTTVWRKILTTRELLGSMIVLARNFLPSVAVYGVSTLSLPYIYIYIYIDRQAESEEGEDEESYSRVA